MSKMSPLTFELRLQELQYQEWEAQYQLMGLSRWRSEIRELAYKKWQAAGCPPGDGIEFWCAAERELTFGKTDSERANTKP